jgi:heterodisulfide reductase subunit C/nitrate reductase gamma subunit
MFFTVTLYTALAVFGIGLIYKISTWFRYKIGVDASEIPTASRVAAAAKGIVLTFFSARIITLLKVFVLDVVLQVRVLREDFLRWLMHICLYGGFILLLLMHALDKFVTSKLFSSYYATLNPFFFLRDLFGALVIVGIVIAVYRRFVLKLPHLRSNTQDRYAIIILAVIMLSGVLLEGAKIGSYTRYQEMVEEYTFGASDSDLRALEAYWVKEYGVVSPNLQGPFAADTLALGKDLHEMSCLQCHSRPQSAFLGYGTAVIMRPIALGLDKADAPKIFWYIHFLACWLGLAYLPFSKMFHILASPVSLLANAVMEKGRSAPANIATRQVLELDACTHCGTCTSRCSVAVMFAEIPNLNILPSEKIASVQALASGRELSAEKLRHIQEGVYLCTNCRRCTVACPVGINLQDLWFAVREALLGKGYPELLALSPFSYYRALMREELAEDRYPAPLHRARETIAAECGLIEARDKVLALSLSDKGFKSGLSLSAEANTFSACFGCETCTTVCPVVANYDKPQEALGLLPHQIMHSCGLGLRDLALGSNMLWDCLTCYQCQEQCPQGVCVTDVLYELKNRAVRLVKEKPDGRMG